MNVQFKQSISFTFAILGVTLLSYSNQHDELPGETMARMMKLGKELATPNENHAFLSQMTGEWLTSTTLMGMEPTTGHASYMLILGNRYLDGMHGGSFMRVPFEGRLTIGYDNYKHKFVSTFIDNLGTSLRFAEGMLDKTGKILSLWGTMDEWMTNEHDKPVLYRYQIIDANHFSFEALDLALGDKSKVIEVMYTRKPAA